MSISSERSPNEREKLDPDVWELNTENVDRWLEQLKRRFIDERVHGYTNSKTKQYFPPVSAEEAAQRWEKVKDHFRRLLSKYDSKKMWSYRYGTHSFNRARAASKQAELDEPSLRRGESLVAYVCGRPIQS